MTADEFNEKYKDYLVRDHYGLDIQDKAVVEYLDKEFQKFIQVKGFLYYQIKLKYGSCRFYCEGLSSVEVLRVEENVNYIIRTT